MLAIAMYSEFQYDLDLTKVLYMLAIHELEEISIGDLTQFEIDAKEKRRIGKDAVKQIVGNLLSKSDLISLIEEFEERKTKEAIFAYYCDKLECDLQCKLYDQESCVDLENQKDNKILDHSQVKTLLNKGLSWSQMWLEFSQLNYGYDSNFINVSNYAINNRISTENTDK